MDENRVQGFDLRTAFMLALLLHLIAYAVLEHRGVLNLVTPETPPPPPPMKFVFSDVPVAAAGVKQRKLV